MKYQELTERIIAAYYQVYNTLGWGFLERVYQNALFLELKKQQMSVVPQARIEVRYKGTVVGEYFADLLVENTVIVEIKAAEQIATEHEAQLLNYLKATSIDVGLLFNFGPKPTFKRKIFETARFRTTVPPPVESPADH
jgi:GxxExxY protein